MRVLLTSSLAENLRYHGLPSLFFPVAYFIEKANTYLARSLLSAYCVPRFQQIISFGTPHRNPFGCECTSPLDYQHSSPSYMGLVVWYQADEQADRAFLGCSTGFALYYRSLCIFCKSRKLSKERESNMQTLRCAYQSVCILVSSISG